MSGLKIVNHGQAGEWTTGQVPEILKRLRLLAQDEGLAVLAQSGYRTPARSSKVGGFPNDPHTKGEAIDAGIAGAADPRAAFGKIPEATLRQYGLTRPFGGAAEANHVQLLPGTAGKPWQPPIPQEQSLQGGVLDVVPGGHQLANAASDAATATAKAVVGLLFDSIGANGTAILLYVVLTAAGAGLAGLGLARAFGVRTDPADLARLAAKGAATA